MLFGVSLRAIAGFRPSTVPHLNIAASCGEVGGLEPKTGGSQDGSELFSVRRAPTWTESALMTKVRDTKTLVYAFDRGKPPHDLAGEGLAAACSAAVDG